MRALSDDPDDFSALTPGHLLIGSALNAVPEPSRATTPRNRLNRWEHLQQMRDHFWAKWAQEFLQELTPRPKCKARTNPLEIGTLCLIKNETTPPTKWPLARVVRVHPGDDGEVRVVTVRTATTELTRPAVKIVPLPTKQAANDAHREQ
ncbi:hypothetical protein RF55_19095 [Lasius niger]|uniref:DUF5641 domain-containing protein n=1 Tax=Lasius niger TaxID=67767 RepID=A0A0J7K0E1_LASNI|nr:hypothetical protein RF55_19095 [Lasius niger]